MSFGSQGGSQKAQPPAFVVPQYNGLQLLTSCESLPVPLVYGFTKVGTNITFQNNFQSHAQLGVGNNGGYYYYYVTGYTYSVDLMFALCEGPITNIGQVWSNSNTYLYQSGSPNPEGWSLSYWSNSGKGSVSTSLFTGAPGQAAWSYLTSGYPQYALAYQGLAYIGAPSFSLGSSNAIGTLNFEIAAILYGTGANGMDADPALVIQDFLTNSAHGVSGFPSSALDTSTLLGVSGDSSVQSYCAALGLCFSPALVQQEAANSILTRWCQLLNLGPVWTGGKLRFVPYGDLSIIGTTVNWTALTSPQYALTADQFGAASDGSPVLLERSDPLSLFNVQRLEVLNRAGVNVNTALVAARTATFQSQMIALATKGLEPGQNIVIPVQGQPQYQASPIEARDLNQAQLNAAAYGGDGVRIAPTITAHEICDLNVGSVIAQTLLQRGLYVRNRFSFKLSFIFCLLDPMDVVSLTEPFLGLSGALVRITSIEEQDDGSFNIEAEELTIGVSTPAPNPTSGTGSSTLNKTVNAQGVDCVTIYQPPTSAAGGNSVIWIAASGGVGGVPDPNFGGISINVSADGGSTYSNPSQDAGADPIGTLSTYNLTTNATTAIGNAVLHFAAVPSYIVAGLSASDATASAAIPAGTTVLSTTSTTVTLSANVASPGVGASDSIVFGASIAATTGWDTASVIPVNLAESGGSLFSTTAGNAQTGSANLALIDGELIAFETATLVAANAYNLTNIQRGLFGTTAATHAAPAQFTLLNSVGTLTLQSGWIGVTLQIKLQAFNTFGNGEQALSACLAIPFTPAASGNPRTRINTVYETVTLSGSSVVTSGINGQIPAGAQLVGVVATVQGAVSGSATSIHVDPQLLSGGGAGGSSGSFGNLALAVGSQVAYSAPSLVSWTSASGITLTAVGGTFSGGTVRVAISYLTH